MAIPLVGRRRVRLQSVRRQDGNDDWCLGTSALLREQPSTEKVAPRALALKWPAPSWPYYLRFIDAAHGNLDEFAETSNSFSQKISVCGSQ